MNVQIYFPSSHLDVLRKRCNDRFCILGYLLKNIYVVVSLVSDKDMPELEKALKRDETLKDIKLIGHVNGYSDYGLSLSYQKTWKHPRINGKSEQCCDFIFFKPPNFRKLEYFSIEPIMLQSLGEKEKEDGSSVLHKKMSQLYFETSSFENYTIADAAVLDKINKTLMMHLRLKSYIKDDNITWIKMWVNKVHDNMIFRILKGYFLNVVTIIVTSIQFTCISIINTINYKIFSASLVDKSHLFRQLDLRLKQINFFPIQFLLYQDENILKQRDDLIEVLNITAMNTSLNINNSNYIVLFNSIWLIVNDILLGMFVWRVIIMNYEVIVSFINTNLIGNLLFHDLHDLLHWISFKHPAGFKLNDELSSFIGSLFLWALKFWKLLLGDILLLNDEEIVMRPVRFSYDFILEAISSSGSFKVGQKFISHSMKIISGILCHCGLTFFLSFMLDYFHVMTFHIYCFYTTSSRIYQRQIEVLKSLFQLFCGKKYNVLRNRVDNLDNYSTASNAFFGIDQLLLGTLIFVVLVFLLPTVMAFYFVLLFARLSCVIFINMLENFLIIINFVPLFVVILKWKNSNRLQGSIHFTYLSSHKNVTYLSLANKSLGYHDIFKNFIRLFKELKNFKSSLVQCFLLGEPIYMKYKHDAKYNYLMLPENHDKSIYVFNEYMKSKRKKIQQCVSKI